MGGDEPAASPVAACAHLLLHRDTLVKKDQQVMALQRENKALKDALDGTEQDAVRCMARPAVFLPCEHSSPAAHIVHACLLTPHSAVRRGALSTNRTCKASRSDWRYVGCQLACCCLCEARALAEHCALASGAPEMETFLNDYGLVWVGGGDGEADTPAGQAAGAEILPATVRDARI